MAWGFGDDNPSGEWLPSPDGFLWPVPAEGAPEFAPTWRRVDELPAEVRAGLAPHWPGRVVPGEDELSPTLPERLRIAEVDLNGDGKDEIFLLVSVYGGSGGPHYEILAEAENGYRRIGGIGGTFRFVQSRNGWLQLESKSRGGGGRYARALRTFDGLFYQVTRNEGHNFFAKTVTVRIPKGPEDGQDVDND